MTILQVSDATFIFSAIAFAVAVILIFLVLLLVFVKWPSPSREASGAIVLTVAAVILLSGAWSMWLSPTIDTRKYDEIAARSLAIEPLGSISQTFEAKDGQEIEVNIDSMGPVTVIREPDKVEQPIYPIFSVKIYDPKGKLVWAQKNVTRTFFTQPSSITLTGTYKVEVTNPEKEAVSLIMRVTDRTKTTIRPLEPVGQWLILISLPIFGLGAWFARLKKVNQSVQT